MKKLVASVVVALVLSGCVTGWMGPQAFSKRWANEQRQQRDLMVRKEHIGKPLLDRNAGPKNEPSPTTFGGEHGLQAQLHGTTGGTLSYKFSW